MKEAFYYMFKDNKFWNKALWYFLFVLIANSLSQLSTLYAPVAKHAPAPVEFYILNVLNFIALFIPTGYSINCISALMEQKDNAVLPMFNIKNCFVSGFKFSVSLLLILSAFGLIYAISMIPVAILLSAAFRTASGILMIALIVLSIIAIFAMVIYSPAFCAIFAKKEFITVFFRFKRATNLIKQGVGNYFKYTIVIILTTVLFSVLSNFIIGLLPKSIQGVLTVAIIISAISAYTMFIYAYLVAKSVKPECIE